MNVSIIVSAYNVADVLGTTLPPLLSQDYSSEKLQIIVVNDASTDETAALLASPEWTDRCEIIHHETNRGRCATRNSGLHAATGDLVIFIDCDIEVADDFVSRHVERHADPQVTGLVSNLQPAMSPLRQKYHRYLFTAGAARKRWAETSLSPTAISSSPQHLYSYQHWRKQESSSKN